MLKNKEFARAQREELREKTAAKDPVHHNNNKETCTTTHDETGIGSRVQGPGSRVTESGPGPKTSELGPGPRKTESGSEPRVTESRVLGLGSRESGPGPRVTEETVIEKITAEDISEPSLSISPPPLERSRSLTPDVQRRRHSDILIRETCDWCFRVSAPQFSLPVTDSHEIKLFCSETCFSHYRRAVFKVGRGAGNVCDHCRQARQDTLVIQDNVRKLYFCSNSCLNLYQRDNQSTPTISLPPGLLLEQLDRCNQLTKQLADRGGQLSERGGQLSERGGQLSDRGGQLSERGGQLSERGGQLTDQGGQLSDRGGQLTERLPGLAHTVKVKPDHLLKQQDKQIPNDNRRPKISVTRKPAVRDRQADRQTQRRPHSEGPRAPNTSHQQQLSPNSRSQTQVATPLELLGLQQILGGTNNTTLQHLLSPTAPSNSLHQLLTPGNNNLQQLLGTGGASLQQIMAANLNLQQLLGSGTNNNSLQQLFTSGHPNLIQFLLPPQQQPPSPQQGGPTAPSPMGPPPPPPPPPLRINPGIPQQPFSLFSSLNLPFPLILPLPIPIPIPIPMNFLYEKSSVKVETEGETREEEGETPLPKKRKGDQVRDSDNVRGVEVVRDGESVRGCETVRGSETMAGCESVMEEDFESSGEKEPCRKAAKIMKVKIKSEDISPSSNDEDTLQSVCLPPLVPCVLPKEELDRRKRRALIMDR